MARTCGTYRSWKGRNASKRSWGKVSAVSSMSTIGKATDKNSSRGLAAWDWRASSPSASTAGTAPGDLNTGSRQKIEDMRLSIAFGKVLHSLYLVEWRRIHRARILVHD